MQLGAVYDAIREVLIESVATEVIAAQSFAKLQAASLPDTGTVALVELEVFVRTGSSASATLGELRLNVDRCLELGANVCLVSRTPRCAFPVVPGSSLLDDAKPYYLDLLNLDEVPERCRDGGRLADPAAVFPAVAFGGMSLDAVYRSALQELGVNVLAAVDAAVFESGARNDFLDHLDVREVEAIRGAGFATQIGSESLSFSLPYRLSEFREAVADVLAGVVDAPTDLADISNGLWKIERSVRLALRTYGISTHGPQWRRELLHGDLATRALDRARLDTSVSARSVLELRDPLEWLSLGELLEVVEANGGLGSDKIFWKKFADELLPIRNRLSHMRLTRKGDKETVSAWVSHVARALR